MAIISKINNIALASMSKLQGVSMASVGKFGGVSRTSNQPSIITANLVQHLDAGDSNSYSGTGTNWYDLTTNNVDGTFRGSPTYSSTDGGGSFYFDGVDDGIKFDYADAAPIRVGEDSGEVDCTQSPSTCTRTYGNLSTYGGFSYQTWVKQVYTNGVASSFTPFTNNNSVTTTEAPSNQYKYYQGIEIALGGAGQIVCFFFDGNGGNTSGDRRDRRTANNALDAYANSWVNIAIVAVGDSVTNNLTDQIKIYIQGTEVSSYGSSTGTGLGLGYRSKFYSTQAQEYHAGIALRRGVFRKGYLSQQLVYDNDLTSTEVLQNFNATKTRYGYS